MIKTDLQGHQIDHFCRKRKNIRGEGQCARKVGMTGILGMGGGTTTPPPGVFGKGAQLYGDWRSVEKTKRDAPTDTKNDEKKRQNTGLSYEKTWGSEAR